MEFLPVTQRTTPETVADALRVAIFEGSLAPGSPLREARISTEMGVSRAPLREALRALEEEGLVVKIPFKGAFVTEISDEVVSEIETLRKVLEPFAIETGLETLRGSGRGDLDQVVAELLERGNAGDVPGVVAAQLAFHRLMYKAASNKTLLDLWDGWESQLRLYLAHDMRSFENPAAVARAHAELAELVLNGDMAAIRKAIVEHIDGVSEVVGTSRKR